MIDLTSALYLGLEHPSRSLSTWSQLTTGRSAVLGEPPPADRVAAALTALTGHEAASLSTSTLHAFFDLFTVVAHDRATVLLDAAAYPVAR